jgi:hypothetical protein
MVLGSNMTPTTYLDQFAYYEDVLFLSLTRKGVKGAAIMAPAEVRSALTRNKSIHKIVGEIPAIVATSFMMAISYVTISNIT